MLKMYGSPKTSAQRCFWVMEELGLPYERCVLEASRKETRDGRPVGLNGAIPRLVDGTFVIWESMAINAYLCEKYGQAAVVQREARILAFARAAGDGIAAAAGFGSSGSTRAPNLLGETPEQNGLIHQWSFWAISELQKPLMDMLVQMHFVPEGKRDPVLCDRSRKNAMPMLAVLDGVLRDKRYLVADRFTLADLNAASVAAINLKCGNDLSSLPHMQEWLRACLDRPAYQRAAMLE